MQLHDDEEILWQTADGNTVLTNFRFRYTRQGTIKRVQSVLLPQIRFCSYTRRHRPELLMIAVALFLVMFAWKLPDSARIGSFALCIAFAIGYGLSMGLEIVVSTSAEAIKIPVSFHSAKFAEEMIDAIEHAMIQKSAIEEVECETEIPDPLPTAEERYPLIYPYTPA